MKLKFAFSLALGTVISALALYFALRNVPFENLWNYVKTINYLWIAPSIGIVLLGFTLRTVRWQMILAAYQRIDFRSAWHPLIIGFSINCILPGRVGEIARPAILGQKKGVPFTTGLATVATERVLDTCTLIIMFAFVLANVQPDPNFSMRFGDMELSRAVLEKIAQGTLKLCVVLIAGIVLVGIDSSRNIIYRIIDWFPRRFSFAGPRLQGSMATLSRILKKIVANVASGFALIKKPRKLILCLVASIAIWILNGLSFYIVALGCNGIGLSFVEIFAAMVIVCFFVALPSVPGYWGIWEAGGVFALSLFGVDADKAAGYTLANHAIQLIPVILLGLVSAWITSVDILKISYQKNLASESTVNVPGLASER